VAEDDGDEDNVNDDDIRGDDWPGRDAAVAGVRTRDVVFASLKLQDQVAGALGRVDRAPFKNDGVDSR
jgi:hypothetical protein